MRTKTNYLIFMTIIKKRRKKNCEKNTVLCNSQWNSWSLFI